MFFGAWALVNGIVTSAAAYPWAWGLVLWAVLVAVPCGIVAFSIWSHRQRHDPVSRAAGPGAIIALGAAVYMGLEFCNCALDRSPAVPVALTVTDFISLTSQSRASEMKSVDFFVAFRAPEDLPQYRFVLVYETTLASAQYAPGRRYRLERHTGFFGKPWYRLVTWFHHYANLDLATWRKHFVFKEADGFFAPDSPYLGELEAYGIPVHRR